MIKNITAQGVVDILNELVEIDRPAIAALVANRVPCNTELANHPSVQVSSQNDGFHVGLLGILNGLFGTLDVNGLEDWGVITLIFDDGNLSHFALTEHVNAINGR